MSPVQTHTHTFGLAEGLARDGPPPGPGRKASAGVTEAHSGQGWSAWGQRNAQLTWAGWLQPRHTKNASRWARMASRHDTHSGRTMGPGKAGGGNTPPPCCQPASGIFGQALLIESIAIFKKKNLFCSQMQLNCPNNTKDRTPRNTLKKRCGTENAQ